MKRTFGLFTVLTLLVGCQQGAKQEGQDDFSLVTQASESAVAARTSFPRALASGRAAVSSAHPRARIVITWGGGLLSCGDWHIQAQSNKPLYKGAVRMFEYKDTAGRIDDKTVVADTRTCGLKDRGAISLDYSDDATLVVTYRLQDRRGSKPVSEGSIDLSTVLKDGGFVPKQFTNGNFIHYYVETY